MSLLTTPLRRCQHITGNGPSGPSTPMHAFQLWLAKSMRRSVTSSTGRSRLAVKAILYQSVGEKLINTYFFQIGLSNHLPVQYGLGRGQARSMPSGSCGKTLPSANSAVAVLAASECVTAYMSPKSRGLAPVCIYEPLPLLLQASERWAA